jgi:16S rRNA (adenine1518-N6/adenine1519-N6)-dimethyltransferase
MPHPDKELQELNARPRKSFSQNFLQSPHWVQKLVDAVLEEDDGSAIWEVGPGLGALTGKLVERAQDRLTLFELDRKLAQGLRRKYPHVPLVEGDFLKADFNQILSDSKKVRLISNLPYHISSPLLFRIIENAVYFDRAVLTFQREFASRLRAVHSTKEYGALSVIAQTALDIRSLGILPPGAFFPKPSVDSEALVLKPKKLDSAQSFSVLSAVVKVAFRHRRKMAVSNLKLEYLGSSVTESIEELGLTQMIRPENIPPEAYRVLSVKLVKR